VIVDLVAQFGVMQARMAGHGDSHLARCSSISCAVTRMARSRVPSPMSS
jgi:hypothetical protein